MLLRASGEHLGEETKPAAAMGDAGGGGVAHGEALVRFAESVTRGSEDADDARSALRAALGGPAFLEAAAIVGIFNGLVRTADATGIPLDDNTLHRTVELRSELGIDGFAGAANTDLERADPARLAEEAEPDDRDAVMRQFR